MSEDTSRQSEGYNGRAKRLIFFATQSIIAIILVVTISYLAISNGNVPDILAGLVGAVIGFYFSEGLRRNGVRLS